MESQALGADRFLGHGIPGQCLIDLLPGLGRDGVAKTTKGRVSIVSAIDAKSPCTKPRMAGFSSSRREMGSYFA